jgi:N-acetylglucosamine kinase-like BadF-type ATPase
VNVTRGQLSKIVSLAANFTDPPGVQLFQDISPGSTFFDYIQRLANRGIIGGYACGGTNEPCVPPANRPYFRQNNNATRGQISKIVSNAAGFNDPPGAQIFQDIAPASTFYDVIQRLANRGVMSGYACGGANEPCVPPANRPYFRQNNNATRGQVSKIVSNAFFSAQCGPANGE